MSPPRCVIRQAERVQQLDLGIPQLSDVSLIGSGGYSDVYVAHHDGLGRRVAVKVIARIDDDDRRSAFERECAAMGRLSDHPHVVAPLSAGTTVHGNPYLLLEYYPDGSCAELISRSGPLGTSALRDWVLQVGDALATAHGRGVVHNDIKPENILVRRQQRGLRFAVTDFGLAHLLDAHTARGVTAGSLLYVAPELLDGQPPRPASDVYGLAATACFIASGGPPFRRADGESWLSVVRRISTELVGSTVLAHVPSPLDYAVAAALSKDPADRPGLDQLMAAAVDMDSSSATAGVVREPDTDAAWWNDAPRAGGMDVGAGVVTGGTDTLSASDHGDDDEESGINLWWFIVLVVVLFLVSVLVGLALR